MPRATLSEFCHLQPAAIGPEGCTSKCLQIALSMKQSRFVDYIQCVCLLGDPGTRGCSTCPKRLGA